MKLHNLLAFVIGTWLFTTNWCMLADGEELACVPGHKVGTRLTINSHKNVSGHWVSQVDLVNHDAEAQRNSWNADVHERTFSCGTNGENNGTDGRSFTAISATLVSPRARASASPPPAGEEPLPKVQFGEAARVLGAGRELFLSRTRLTWEGARRACRQHGMRLADAASPASTRALRMMLRERDARPHHAFVDDDQEPRVHRENLRSPNATAPDKCPIVSLKYPSNEYRNFVLCSEKSIFFCQINYVPSA